MTSKPPRADENEATESPVGRILKDEFRIDAELGAGGMSKVYRAHQLSVDRPVVVKVMTPPERRFEEWRARFLQEARAASRVSHPGIVTIYSFGEEPGVGPFIAMEYVDGVGLRKLLAAVGQFEPERACRLMASVCRAMHDAHEAGVVHRDLKPDNIVVEKRDDREVPRVLDFGVAKPSNAMVNTLDSEVVGTPDYMAPEQARKNPVDARTDVYSAGIILYELLFGKRPFYAPEPLPLMFKHVNEPLPLDDIDPQWPAGIGDALRCACAKDPDDRFQTAREMAIALEEIVAETETPENSDPTLVDETAVSAELVAPVATPGPGSSHTSDASDDDRFGTRERSQPEGTRENVASTEEEVRSSGTTSRENEVAHAATMRTPAPEFESERNFPWLVVAGAASVVIVAAVVALNALWPEPPPSQPTPPPDPPPVESHAKPPPVAEEELPGRQPPPQLPGDASATRHARNQVGHALAQAAGASDYAADTLETKPPTSPEPRTKPQQEDEDDGFDLVEVPREAPPDLSNPFEDDR